MYINFWYPIVRSEDLAMDEPEKVRVLGVDLVAFRDDEGEAHVLSNTCVHRGGSLGGAGFTTSVHQAVRVVLVPGVHRYQGIRLIAG